MAQIISSNLETMSGTVSYERFPTSYQVVYNPFSPPKTVAVEEYDDRIEIYYREEYTGDNPFNDPRVHDDKVFKIVFSCKDGEWHKSERISGLIVPAKEEYFEFSGGETYQPKK